MCDLEIWWMTLENNREPLLCWAKLCASFQSHQWFQTGVTVWKCSIRVKIGICFVPCDLEIWQTTLKNNRTTLLYYAKICTSFQTHQLIQTWVTVRKYSILAKIDFLSRVTLKFDRWPWKQYGTPLYAVSFFASLHSHQWIQTGVTVWKRQIWVKIDDFFCLCDLEIWQMTLNINRKPLLSNIKLSASFHHHMWIQTGVMVGFWPLWPWPLASGLDLLQGHYFEQYHNEWIHQVWYRSLGRFARKCTETKKCDRRTDGRTDGQSLSYSSPPTPLAKDNKAC